MRATKLAISEALAADAAVAELVDAAQVFAVERATVPVLPSIEVIAVSSERQDTGPMVRHELQVEVTVSHATEDGADAALDAIVAAVRRRLSESETNIDPIALPTREGLTVSLGSSRWSVSALGSAGVGVVRGASVAVSVLVSE